MIFFKKNVHVGKGSDHSGASALHAYGPRFDPWCFQLKKNWVVGDVTDLCQLG